MVQPVRVLGHFLIRGGVEIRHVKFHVADLDAFGNSIIGLIIGIKSGNFAGIQVHLGQVIRRGNQDYFCVHLFVLAAVSGFGFLRGDQFAAKSENGEEMLDSNLVANEPFKVALIHANPARKLLPDKLLIAIFVKDVAIRVLKHIENPLGNCSFAHLHVELFELLPKQKTFPSLALEDSELTDGFIVGWPLPRPEIVR